MLDACLDWLLFLAGDAEALATLPETFAANSELLGQLGFVHVVLVFQDKALEIIFE